MQVSYDPWKLEEKAWGVKITSGQFAETTIGFNNFNFDVPEAVAVDFSFVSITEGTDPENADRDSFTQVLQYIVTDLLKRAIAFDEDRKSNPK